MKILHISAECYPAAKAGGLGDVAGALPKYLNTAGVDTALIMPKYYTKWLLQQKYETDYQDFVQIHQRVYPFTVERVLNDNLGYPLYVIDIPGKFDRPGVYTDPTTGQAYNDEIERSLCFQNAVLHWVRQFNYKPEILHCHDHHTGLIPFMVKHCPEYRILNNIPTVFTIHNGMYHGAFGWDLIHMLPFFDEGTGGMLDWNGMINPLATAVKTCTRLTTVSSSYLYELREHSNGIELLLWNEAMKSRGILNGIDLDVWDPATDPFIAFNLKEDIRDFKRKNKEKLLEHFHVRKDLPLITFIGRLVGEKGADLLSDIIRQFLAHGQEAAFAILGTGEPHLHLVFDQMREQLGGYFDVKLEYNEGLAHQMYAGSDFLIMPSKVEPCGLNQMYALRYGTIPIVRSVGGLRDTVPDIGEPDGKGRGIRFDHFSVEDGVLALYRATQLFENKKQLEQLRQNGINADFSWDKSANEYIELYKELSDSV